MMTERSEGAAPPCGSAGGGRLIDWARAAELRSEVGAESFDEIVALFLAEVQRTLDALPAQAGDVADLAETLHFLKGSALNLGFTQLSALCDAGERAASTGHCAGLDLQPLHACFARSRAEFLEQRAERLAA